MFAMLAFTACGGDNSSSDNSSSDNETGYATYKEALAANDFESAHKIIAQAEADLAKVKSRTDGYSYESFAEKYGIEYDGLDAAKDEIFDKESRFLVANGSSEAVARLVFLFSEIKEKGTKLSPGLNDYYAGCELNRIQKNGGDENGYDYFEFVNNYNHKLNVVLDLAISQDNKEIASKIIKLYKENMDIFMGGSSQETPDGRRAEKAPDGTWVDGNHCYVTYSWKDKEAAQKKYEENFGSLNETEE